MSKLMKALVASADEYTVVDFGALKIAMLTLGIIIGVCFANTLLKWTPLLWIVFIATYVYIVVRTLRGVEKNKKKVTIKKRSTTKR